jgi:hypothetical protein
MKIKLSKQQWQLIGKKTGWIKKAQVIPDDGIADGGTPYTEEEMNLIESKESKNAKIDAIKNNNNRTEKLLKLLELYFSTYPKTTGAEVKTFWNNICDMSLEDMNTYIDNFVSRW